MSFVNSPFFQIAAPYMSITGKDFRRIDIKSVPKGIARQLVAYVAPCVACGCPVHPVRSRGGISEEERGNASGLFYAPTCEAKVNLACARTAAAKADKREVVAALLRRGVVATETKRDAALSAAQRRAAKWKAVAKRLRLRIERLKAERA